MSFFCVTCPAIAGELASWQFDQTQNRLEFTTNEGVQPRAQLVPDPTRLVIDLPGTTMGEVQRSQLLSGAMRQIRIGQFDANTTRIVVELAPGYVLDPQQVQFRGLTPTQWTVQLPSPTYVGVAATAPPALGGASGDRSLDHSALPLPPVSPSPNSPIQSAPPSPPPNFQGATVSTAVTTPPPDRSSPVASSPAPASPAVTSPPPAVVDDSVTQIESLQVTNDGLFLRTRGAAPEIDDIDRSRNRRSITITIENAVVSPQLTEPESIEQFGIEQLQFEQTEQDDDEPPVVEITLEVDRDSPNWNASASGMGGIVLLPQQRSSRQVARRSSATRDADAPVSSRRSSRNSSRNSSRDSEPEPEPAETSESPEASEAAAELPVATIEGIELDPSGTQLLIRSDRPMTHLGQWRSGMYQVRLSPARLADRVTGPQMQTNSPLLGVRLREEEDETVVVMIQPAAGVRFGALNAVTPQLLSLEMERSQPSQATLTPPANSSRSPSQPDSFSPSFPSSNSANRLPNNRVVIVIDPGHGGADVGAVGVGNIHEADVVLPIAQQVGAFLQQQGVYVVMTRNDDREIDLEPRVQMAEQANATLFVSIHANSMGMDRPDVNGTETYYYSSGAGLAQVIQTNIVNAVGTNDRGIRQARFYVLRRTTMPAVLVETGYVTGSEDGPRLADANFQTQMARAIAQGILQYIQSMARQ